MEVMEDMAIRMVKTPMIIDIHSHILHGVDDGAESFEESVRLLSMLKNQGVDCVIATPHFTELDTNIEKYKSKVYSRFNRLMESDNIPELFLGYEFKYFRGMSNSGLPEQFCLGKSNYILLELPYEDISIKTLEEVERLRYDNNLLPILAHIDRYVPFKNYNELIALLKREDIFCQINANAVYCEKHKKNAINLMKSGIINFVGSDTHSIDKRPPNMDKFFEIANKKCPDSLNEIIHNSEVLYNAL